MKAKQDIKLYQEAFDITYWKNEDKIKELLESIGTMERIIENHLKNIKEHFPNLTDHSIMHSNMLWEYADIIVGSRNNYLNPLEAFILNSVFLLHDAGICYSLLHKKEEIKNDPIFNDYIKINDGKFEKELLEEEALFYTVRENHGHYALRIAKEQLPSEEYFISSVIYRDEFADFIGKISKSHTCNIVYIEREFGNSYTSPRFPNEWSIDIKKIAYLLRTSDAADIDNLRTPKTLKVISEIKGDSREHWTFQKKLGFPTLEKDGHLIYSTNNPFKKNEQKAWWYCFNALKVLDDELKNANNYFVSKNQDGFDAKSVKYINDPLMLGKDSIKTIGWDSINTSIRVSNPVHIASELGGIKLYGEVNMAVRELIQNSIDAIHVYRLYTMQDNLAVGKIKISFEKESNDYFLIVTDNGIGMSQNLLTNELLDFGGSYWKSNKFYNDFKGLPSKGFESIGKYGIGFFSTFMLGKNITVTSWKYGESIDEMRTLDFYDGLSSNPILRQPTDKEKNSIVDRGTSVRIKLENNPYEEKGIIYKESFKNANLKSLVQYYIPSTDIEINITELDGTISYLLPNTIEKLNFPEIIEYTNIRDNDAFYKKIGIKNPSRVTWIDKFKDLPMQLIEVIHEDKLLGKLLILPKNDDEFIIHHEDQGAIVLAKGIRVSTIPQFVGYILTDEVVTIKRDQSANIIPYESMREWASKQLDQIEKLNLKESYVKKINDLIVSFNFFDDSFVLTRRKKDNIYTDVTIAEFKDYVKHNDKVEFYDETDVEEFKLDTCEGFINVAYGLDMEKIIIASDLEKVNHTSKIIRNILKDVWKEFEHEIDHASLFGRFEKEPYRMVWKFIRKGNS
jgi:hypothetical protein